MMDEDRVEDLRIFERFPKELDLRFLDIDSNREGQAKTADISAKGLGLVADEELIPRSSVELWLQMPDSAESFYTRGTVVWSKMIEPNRFKAGVSLERADLMGLSRVMRKR